MPNDLEIGKSFFHYFSMFEYALKANGYSHKTLEGIIKQPDWEGFVRDNKELLDLEQKQNERIAVSINYLLDSPPKQQAEINDGCLEWVSPVIDENAPNRVKLCKYIRQVRNNLFHGGKFKGNYFSTPERSRELIFHCREILNHLATNNEGIRRAFDGAEYNIHEARR